jgi:hypothetical protein
MRLSTCRNLCVGYTARNAHVHCFRNPFLDTFHWYAIMRPNINNTVRRDFDGCG